MRECSICGLTFLRGDICPGCGSNVHEQIISDDPEEVEIDKIPGMEQFLETSMGVLPEPEKDGQWPIPKIGELLVIGLDSICHSLHHRPLQ